MDEERGGQQVDARCAEAQGCRRSLGGRRGPVTPAQDSRQTSFLHQESWPAHLPCDYGPCQQPLPSGISQSGMEQKWWCVHTGLPP